MKVLDLFSGIGGFSLGLERAGMETVAFCEIDEPARKVLDKHWPNVPKFEDVTKLKAKHLPEGIDLICGGFPCQDISVAGKGKGFKDELGQRTRSGLWEEFKRLIKEVKPRYVIAENVANLRSKGLNQVIQDLWSLGYVGEWHIISARSIGAPHLRERIWIIAHANGTAIRNEGKKLHNENRSASKNGRESLLQENRSSQNMEPGASTSNPTNPNSERLEGQRKPERVQAKHASTNSSHDEPTKPNNFRLWQPFASEEAAQGWWSETASSLSHWKEAQSIVCGVSDGLSRGMDRYRKERIKQLGNAVVPQIPQLIGEAIMKHENQQGDKDGTI